MIEPLIDRPIKAIMKATNSTFIVRDKKVNKDSIEYRYKFDPNYLGQFFSIQYFIYTKYNSANDKNKLRICDLAIEYIPVVGKIIGAEKHVMEMIEREIKEKDEII